MSGVLRAYGEKFQIEDFLETTDIEPWFVYHKGDKRGDGIWEINGFNAAFTEADFEDFETQIADAISFLHKHESELKRLAEFSGIESVCLDFALKQRGAFMFSDRLPAKLLALAGNLGIDIVMSYYIPSKSESV